MENDKVSLGDRMKTYESVTEFHLTRRIPVIIRIDGRAFHSFTRKFGRGWNEEFVNQMIEVAKVVQKDIQGCNFCYCQSDEVSFLLTDYKTIRTSPWFDYDARKLVSISASLASSIMTLLNNKVISFDSRAFSLPQDEVCNYFIWRQQDATRNAIQMAGQEHFSHKQLNNLSCNDIQEKLFQEKQINFNDYPVIRKRGFCVINDVIDKEIPIFSQDRNYVERFVNIRED